MRALKRATANGANTAVMTRAQMSACTTVVDDGAVVPGRRPGRRADQGLAA